jgi:hypothetical protein
MSEIINLLQSEIKTTRHSETITTDTVSCRNCIKPEKQLRLALKDSCLQKPNTEREKKEAKKRASNVLQQEETGDSSFSFPTSNRFSVLAAALEQSAGFSVQEQDHGTQPEKMSQYSKKSQRILKGSPPNVKENPPTDAMDQPPFYKIFTIPTVINGVLQKALSTKSGPPLSQKKI